MLLLTCPHCGDRDEVEFHYGGQAHVPYPLKSADLSDDDWAAYLFYRDNTKGEFAERWLHQSGCRKWFNAIRDTSTHRFLAFYPIGDERPTLPSPHTQGDAS